ncbi:hypothetical protein FQN57_005113 [Myotisia sp. PD_48]|nr:hypothetical protein FQN57_005113 [Myotisia sp. PD_48]
MPGYVPDGSAKLNPPWNTVELSQRDIALQIPLDHSTHPAISVSAACFGLGVYEDEGTAKCISNLLAVGYRRLYFDVYWSSGRRQWGFCPVAIPANAVGVTPIPTSPVASAAAPTITTGTISAVESEDGTSSNLSLSPTMTGDLEAGSSVSPVAAHREVPTTATGSGAVLYNLGPYSCTQSINLSVLINVLRDYLERTENTVDARFVHLTFNLHNAVTDDHPDEPPGTPMLDDLPPSSHLLGKLLDRSLGLEIYSPSRLDSERQDINSSWYSASPAYRPIAEYYNTTRAPRGHQAAPDGWPTRGYTVLSQAKRLLLSWGEVAPQMASYNFSGEQHLFFSRESTSSPVDITFDSNDKIESGCLHAPDSTANMTSSSHSWAIAQLPSRNSSDQLSSLARQLVSCGISPLVNQTLLNVTADINIEPYRNLSLSSVWTWAKQEPRNSTGAASPHSGNTYRCAVLDTSLDGQWRANGCGDIFYAACRVANAPYKWTISQYPATYSNAQFSCPENTSFAVPRTALENTSLYNYILSSVNTTQLNTGTNSTSSAGRGGVVWIDFNSIDVSTCWVAGGPGAQCPYEVNMDEIERRTIIVPTAAAIIVLLLTALTLFVKCNANRRNSRRRRVIEGWEYEGVPS